MAKHKHWARSLIKDIQTDVESICNIARRVKDSNDALHEHSRLLFTGQLTRETDLDLVGIIQSCPSAEDLAWANAALIDLCKRIESYCLKHGKMTPREFPLWDCLIIAKKKLEFVLARQKVFNRKSPINSTFCTQP